jgi:sulfite exporter TauE/SafE
LVDTATILLEGLILGLTVGTSCLITCLPILVAHITADHPGFKNGFISSISFSFGRLLAYFLWAIIFGMTGYLLDAFLNSSTSVFVIFSSVMIAFLILYGLSLVIGETYFPSLSSKVCAFTRKNHSSLVLGILIGLFPCGPLIYIFGQAVLLGANNLFLSFIFFLVFWIGTTLYLCIAGISIGGSAAFIRRHEKVERIRFISGLILIILGLFHLMELLNLF